LNPGYIKGYVPGVRENGGQYTHAAIWLVMAFASMGDTEKAWELIKLINPINHGADGESVKAYKVEPYVIAADVYGVPLHKGRGGWTWYTGSAGWMYQLVIESFLGLRKESNRLYFNPRVPPDWQAFTIRYRVNQTEYEIVFKRSEGKPSKLMIDGAEQDADHIVLTDDGQKHTAAIGF